MSGKPPKTGNAFKVPAAKVRIPKRKMTYNAKLMSAMKKRLTKNPYGGK